MRGDVFESFMNSSLFHLEKEDEKFYKSVISKQLIVQVEIQDTKDILKDQKKLYTIYRIKVTNKVQSYTIDKRFSEFKELERKLEETHKNAPQLKKILVNKFNSEKIQKRKQELQTFLDYFFEEINRGQAVYPFLQFLQIKEKFQELKIDLDPQNQENQAESIEKMIDYQTNVSHEKKILEMLIQAQKNKDNLNKILQNIAEMISISNPITDHELIRLIMGGTYSSSNKNFKGLMQLCGQFDIYIDPETNEQTLHHINCCKNLEILSNLMECEYNSSYELFLKLFQDSSIAIIKTINLEQHILSDKPCKSPALKIINKYIDGLRKMYSNNDVRFLLQKIRTVVMKARTIEEIQNFIDGKKTLKKVQSQNFLDKQARDTTRISLSQSNYLSFSYLEAEEDKYFNNTRSIKDALEDQFIQWKTVYHLKEKQIILQHTFPVPYIKMSVVLPVNPQECLDLIVTQRNQWDSLLMDCFTIQNQDMNNSRNSPTKKKEKYSASSLHDYICETYRWCLNKRTISFYSERKIQTENQRIYITRTSFEPKDHHNEFSNKNENHVGKWECLVLIKQLESVNMNSSVQSLGSIQASPLDIKEKFRIFNFNTNQNISNLPKLGKLFSGKDLVQSTDQLSKSGSSEDLNKLADISNSGIKFKEYILEEEIINQENSSCEGTSQNDFIQATEINVLQKQEQKDKIHSGLLSLEESKALQDSKQTQANDGQETLPNTLNQQNNSYLEQSSYSQRKKSSSKQSKKEILERESENDDSEESKIYHTNLMNKSLNLSEQSKQINPEYNSQNSPFIQKINTSNQKTANFVQNKDSYDDKKQKEHSSLSDASGCSINFLNSAKSQNMKKNSDDIYNTELEDSILIDSESEQVITKNQPNTQEQQQPVSTQITFMFHLQNLEAIHFFSKFISKGDDETMIQSMVKLQDLAKKIRKESSSTTDTKNPDRKESSNSQISQNSDFSKIID